MKKLVTMDELMVSLVGAVGYGAGYAIPDKYGVNSIVCMAICFVAGMVLDEAAHKLVFNRVVQKNKINRYCVFAGITIFFIAAFIAVENFFGHSLMEDVGEEIFYAIATPVGSLAFAYFVRNIKNYRLSKKYGSGEGGFVIDKGAIEQLKALEGENKQLAGYSGKNPVVKAPSGTYIGKNGKKAVRFLGITYAKAERFKKAVMTEDSEGIYEAYYFGNSQLQPENSHNVLSHMAQGEDCLNLNIWTAKLKTDEKKKDRKPVLVYFHGGDGRYGGSANPVYHLENIAKAIPDAVFVSVNYRFGVLGVVDFSSTDCPDKEEYADSTALSLFDQIEALKWIHKNIRAFGGNPDNITVAGDSAGGSDILLLSAAEEAKGLFKRALVICASTMDTPDDDGYASKLGEKLIEEFNAKSVSDLNKLTETELRDFSAKYYNLIELPPRNGRLIPSEVEKAYLDGAAADIEFILCMAADDFSAWQGMLAGDVSFDDMVEPYFEGFKAHVAEEKQDMLEELLRSYMQSDLSDLEAKKALMSDFMFKAAVLHDLRTLAEGGSKVRCLFWNVDGSIEHLKANAVSLVTAFLGNMDFAEQMGYIHDKHITEILQALAGKYISGQAVRLHNNEIMGVSEIVWNRFTSDRECVLQVQNGIIKTDNYPFEENVRKLENLMFE